MSLEDQMNRLLMRLGVPLRVVWLPSENSREHARIIPEESLLMIYDKSECEAWQSLFHEILEYRFRSILSPYRELVNKLIETVEQLTYREKERVLDQIAKDFQVWRSFETERSSSTNQRELDKHGES